MVDSIPSNFNLNYIPWFLNKFNNSIFIRQVVPKKDWKTELGGTQEFCLVLLTQLNVHTFFCQNCCFFFSKSNIDFETLWNQFHRSILRLIVSIRVIKISLKIQGPFNEISKKLDQILMVLMVNGFNFNSKFFL